MISKRRLRQLETLIENGHAERFYVWPEWDEMRKRVRSLDHNECVLCKARGKYTPAEIVHHVKHLQDRPDLALSIYDPDSNERQLISLCRPCHEAQHPERLRSPWTASDKPQLTAERWD